MTISDRARELHDRAIIIDGHNDTLILRQSRGESLDMTQRDERYHLDVPRALEGGLTCSFSMVGDNDCHQTMVLIDAALRMADEHPDLVIFATTAAEIERAHEEGKYATVGQLEGCTFMNGDTAGLRNAHRLGVRVVGLTHGGGGPGTTQHEKSPFEFAEPSERHSARDLPGLTDFGREVVSE
ncbi:MAG: membrane dipeptidase, partial [Armatimonadota bacterium]